MVDIIRHDIEQFAADWYLQTHATNPLLTATTISGALEELETPGNP
jgi:CMP-N-acetylneuraminic acid synthetase